MNKSTSNQLFSSPGGLNRRAFLATAAMASTITIIPRHVLGGPGQSPPSERVNVAGIGVGGMGGANLQALASQNIAALCDVDHENAAHTFKEYPKAKLYTDYRELLEREKDHRGGAHRHAGPHARGDFDGGHEGGQTRLLPETADARRV